MASHETGRNLGGLQNKNVAGPTEQLEEDGLAVADGQIVSKIWTTVTWDVFDGDVQIMLALRSILGWRKTVWWRSRSSWSVAWDPYNVQRWKHNVGFHNRGVQWDTSMAKWAGEGKDWIKFMAQTQLRKEDIFSELARICETASGEENGTQRDQADKETKGPASP